MNKEGSVLFEMIIYVTLSAGLVLLFFNGAIAFSSLYLQQMSAVMKSTSIQLASDLLYRDIVQLSDSQILSQSDSHIIVFRQISHDVGWLHDNKKRLCRVTGIYDSPSQSWITAQKTIVLPSLDTFACTRHKTAHDEFFLKYIIGHGGSLVEQVVYLHGNTYA